MPLFVDTATWIAIGLAIGATVIALIIAVLTAVVLRSRRQSPEELNEALKESIARTEKMLSDLSGSLERVQEESRRSRQLTEVAATMDVDSVLTRTLELAIELDGVDAAMVTLPSRDPAAGTEPLIATIGMSADEAARQPSPTVPPGPGAGPIRVSYSYRAERLEEEPDAIRGGMIVALKDDEGEPIGSLAAFWRDPEREPPDDELSHLEEIAVLSGPAIENARRFREVRQLADLDALTSLHNRRYFHETLAREVARAHRYDRRLAIIMLDIDDFKLINDELGHLAGDTVLAGVAECLRSVVRSADIACRVGGDEFAVILPESVVTDAEQLYRRVQFAVGARPITRLNDLYLSAGIAEMTPDDDAKSFFERADKALYQAKNAGKGQVMAADGIP
jgi:diguanylate cyclase (GGDEF)-like protein